MYKAYREGRAGANPADSWYKGEIGFFDFYSKYQLYSLGSKNGFHLGLTMNAQLLHPSAVIPLSKKLRDCGVFGPTSDENLNYATNNRNMWVKEGEEITRKMLEKIEREYEAREAAIDPL